MGVRCNVIRYQLDRNSYSSVHVRYMHTGYVATAAAATAAVVVVVVAAAAAIVATTKR